MRLNGHQGGLLSSGAEPWDLNSELPEPRLLACSLWMPVLKPLADGGSRQCTLSDPIPPGLQHLKISPVLFLGGLELFRVCGIVSAPALSLRCELSPSQFALHWVPLGKAVALPRSLGWALGCLQWDSCRAGFKCRLHFQISHHPRWLWTPSVGI